MSRALAWPAAALLTSLAMGMTGAAAKQITVGLITKTNTNPFFVKMKEGAEAKAKGYEGEMCGECGNFTLVRNGTCMKCDTCGSTTGCS